MYRNTTRLGLLPCLARRSAAGEAYNSLLGLRGRGVHGALRGILVRGRIAEIGKHPVAQKLGPSNLVISCAAVLEPAHDVALLFWIKACGERGRTDHIAEHDRELTALWRLRRKERASRRLRVEAMIWRETYPAVGAEIWHPQRRGSRSEDRCAIPHNPHSVQNWRQPIHLPTVRTRHVWRPRLSTPHNLARWLTNAPAAALVGVDAIKAADSMKVGETCRPQVRHP
jgi:hypothetical protein